MPDSPHLLIAYDGSEQATEAIVFAARQARAPGLAAQG
jgi:hypothetical protein